MTDLIEPVAALLQEVASAEITPRFRRLADGDIREKRPGDLVTTADLAAEAALTAGLQSLLPGSVVVGEEASASDPTVLERLDGPAAVWVIDPVDGTRNFAAGMTPFVSMIALVESGETRAGWILDPIEGTVATVWRGCGVIVSDERCRFHDGTGQKASWRGRFNMGKGGQRRQRGEAIRRGIGGQQPLTSAGASYLELLTGRIDFAIFQSRNLMPWDHLPGALMTAEAGGTARVIGTGEDYRAGLTDGPLLIARDLEIWQEIAGVYSSFN